MEEVLYNLKKRIADLAEGIRKKEIRPEDVDGHVYKIIDEAVELYKREDIKLLMPLNNGGPLLFQENGVYFIPLYSCKEEIKECMASDFSNVSFKLICDYVFGLISSEQEFPEIKGIMLDPESDDLFSGNAVGYADRGTATKADLNDVGVLCKQLFGNGIDRDFLRLIVRKRCC